MCFPVILALLIFCYLPMPGLYVAFIDYNYARGLFGSAFVGFQNFRPLILSGTLWTLTRNTILYNIAFILTGNVVQLIFAILLNEIANKFFRRTTQSIMILPHFISIVVVGLFLYSIINYDRGILNNLLVALGQERISVYSTPSVWPGLLVLLNLWKSVGYGTIVYFAAITGMDSEMMEAAHIDGATTWQRIRYIQLPSLRPTFVIVLLLALGGVMRGNFGLFYNTVGAQNSMLYDVTDIIETYVFRALMNNFNFSIGSAVSLYQSVVGLVIILSANTLARRIDPDCALF
ncbi:MAG: sugar ABC transporter permease [Clostridiales bacterium]|nr:sugar ABC transporter permease [Clostridiales bacterium]